MSTKSFSETITTRYNKEHQKVYNEVMDIVNKDSITKSTAQLLLVERGLVHTNNPEPLVKEVEKKVYVDRPVVTEKKVYVDKPVYIDSSKTEHIIDKELGQANRKGQRADDDSHEPNKAKSDSVSSKLALEEEKSSNGSNVGSWIVGLGALGFILYGVYKYYT